MAFAPIGFRFDVRSSDSVAEAKAKIRKQRKPIFHPRNSARGWIIGPILVLWYSAYGEGRPMLFGKISGNADGSHVWGHAGRNPMAALFGVAMWLVLTYQFARPAFEPGKTLTQLAVAIVACVLLFGFLCLVLHQSRSESWMLVRFLEDTLTPKPIEDTAPPDETVLSNHQLSIDGETPVAPVTVSMVDKALRDEQIGFLILSLQDEVYVQTYRDDDHFRAECRRGSAKEHYRAVRRGEINDTLNEEHFSVDEVVAIFKAFGTGGTEPEFLEWRPMYS